MVSSICMPRYLFIRSMALLLLSGAAHSHSDINMEKKLDAMFQGSHDDQKNAADYVLQHPDAVQPIGYAYVINTLWAEGNRSQAAFWFYIFQSRTLAWAKADTSGNGVAALRASLNDGLGQTINQWAASDPVAWHDIAARAISYEKKMPLYPGKPDGMSESHWRKLVADSRTEYAAGFTKAFSGILTDENGFIKQRAANGLYVGPLKDPGQSLPQSWR